MADLNTIVDSLSSLTVMEAAELAKLLEEKWGVSAAAPVAMMAGGGAGADAAAVEEKDVRVITSLGLKEAKELVEGVPNPLKEAVSKDEAQKLKEQIEAAGGQVDIK